MRKSILALMAFLAIFLCFPKLSKSQSEDINLPLTAQTDHFIIEYQSGFSPDELNEKIANHAKLRQSALGRSYLAILATIEQSPDETLTQIGNYDNAQGISKKEKLFSSADPKLRQFYTLHIKNPSDRDHLKSLLKNFKKQKFIKSVSPDMIVHPPATIPNDTYWAQQWNLTRVQADLAWDLQKGNTDIVIGNIDSGVDYDHPDFNPSNIIMGYNYIQNNLDPRDEYGHGTAVAGIMGAVSDNSQGIAGIDWNMKLLAIKMYDANGSGQYSYMDQGIVYATDNGAKIINIEVQSVSGYICPSSTQTAIDYARANGVIVVVPAGNYNGNVSQFTPSGCTGTIVVGATDQNDDRAVWGSGQASNYGLGVDVSAPGINTYAPMSSPCNSSMLCYNPVDSDYLIFGGTSGAAPHVVGAVALLLAQNPNLTQDQIENYLITTGDTITTDQPIGPRLNIYQALQAVIADMTPPTYTLSGNVFIDTDGNGIKDGAEVGFDSATLDITGTATASTTTNSSGDYQFTNLIAGSYTTTLAIPDGYQVTTNNPVTQSISDDTTLNFGIQLIPTYTISGNLFIDTNDNGVKDDGETNSDTITVSLTGASTGSTTSDVDGNYQFSGLLSGSYTVDITIPSGYEATTPDPVTQTISANATINFGIRLIPTYTISGNIFVDIDGNGIKDGEDTNYSGVSLTLTGLSSGDTTSDASGNYQFIDLYSGSYTVTMTIPSSYYASTPNPVTQSINANTTLDFGLTLIPTYTISGTVYIDNNSDGVKDEGEAGFESATVSLSGASTGTAVSNSSGSYQFSALLTESYTVTLTVPDGYSATTSSSDTQTISTNVILDFGLIAIPSPTPTPTLPTASLGNVQINPPNTLSFLPDYNFPPHFKSRVMAGPTYVGIQPVVIKGGPRAEGAEAVISPSSLHDGATVTISHVTPIELLLLPKPFPWMQGINTVGEIYFYKITAAFNGMDITKFDKPITIVVPYDPARLWGVNTARLRVVTYQAKTKRWQLVPAPVVLNVRNHTLATTVSSFSYFAVGYLKY